MADETISLKQGLAAFEKALEGALSEQRKIAHSAIDMDDWNKAQEILAAAKKNISAVETLRAGFAECKKRVLAVDLAGDLARLGVTLPVNSDCTGSGSDGSSPAPSENSKDSGERENHSENSGGNPPAAGAAEDKNTASDYSFVDELELLIEKYPFKMAVANSASGVDGKFTYDELDKADMKAPEQLSNGLWAETDVSADEARGIIAALEEFCKQS